ncbi:MAG: hypothetical protein JOZ19_00260 [Rubrobacter sp.]|nr:hypothetical protein [Rubrobacter sp.]
MIDALSYTNVSLAILVIIGVATLVIGAYALRSARRSVELSEDRLTSLEAERKRLELFGEVHRSLEEQLQREHQERLDAQERVQQLEEERPEKLIWERQQLREELEQWRKMYSETQREHGQEKQGWVYQAEQWEHKVLGLEQEHQRLMEEVERWQGRYSEARREVEELKRGDLEVQRKVEQLAQERERLYLERQQLVGELREIGSRYDASGADSQREQAQDLGDQDSLEARPTASTPNLIAALTYTHNATGYS